MTAEQVLGAQRAAAAATVFHSRGSGGVADYTGGMAAGVLHKCALCTRPLHGGPCGLGFSPHNCGHHVCPECWDTGYAPDAITRVRPQPVLDEASGLPRDVPHTFCGMWLGYCVVSNPDGINGDGGDGGGKGGGATAGVADTAKLDVTNVATAAVLDRVGGMKVATAVVLQRVQGAAPGAALLSWHL